MSRRVKSLAFVVLLGISIALLLPLLCGYAARTGVSVRWAKGGSPPAYRWVILTAEEGRVRLWVESGPPAKVPPGKSPTRWGIDWYPVWPLRPPDIRRSIWEFDAHRLPATRNAFILAFPSWCAIAICLIAPGIWFARHRPRREERGFSVVQAGCAEWSK